MDTSEIYIKMSDCEEIQKEWKSEDWDYMYSKDKNELEYERVKVLSGYETDGDYYGPSIDYFNKEDWIWLPRQDQIQKIIYAPINTNATGAMFAELADFGFSEYMDNEGVKEYPELTSGEQLWLAFYMWEKYKKKWDGKKWK